MATISRSRSAATAASPAPGRKPRRPSLPAEADEHAPLALPPLPYAEDALVPVISARTVSLHHGKHHRGYVDTLNELVAGTELAGEPLESIVLTSAGRVDQVAIFHNAAQAWNHAFYWRSLKPGGGGKPRGALGEQLASAFGGFDTFRRAFANAAVTEFGSGWAWLVLDDDELKVVQTHDADVPLIRGEIPLLALDVWEHAYYLDYQNRRADYVDALIDRLLDWDFAAENLALA